MPGSKNAGCDATEVFEEVATGLEAETKAPRTPPATPIAIADIAPDIVKFLLLATFKTPSLKLMASSSKFGLAERCLAFAMGSRRAMGVPRWHPMLRASNDAYRCTS